MIHRLEPLCKRIHPLIRFKVYCLCITLLCLTSCNKPNTSADKAETQSLTEQTPKAAVRQHIPKPDHLPQLLEDQQLDPLQGDALLKAKLPLAEILKQLDEPEYLKKKAAVQNHPNPNPDFQFVSLQTQDTTSEPPAQAMKLYARARIAFKDGQAFQAIRFLEAAQRIAPEEFPIINLLGQVYLVSGNQAKATEQFKHAIKLKPDDIQTLFMLGRVAHDQAHLDEAIYILGIATNLLEEQSVDTAIEYLLPFYLAQSLKRSGYLAAAAEQFDIHLTKNPPVGRISRIWRELPFIARRRGQIHMDRGDINLRLRQFEDARTDYQLAVGELLVDDVQITARLVYVNLMLQDGEQAQSVLLDKLQTKGADEKLAELIPYLAKFTGDKNQFINEMKKLYFAENRAEALAMSVALLLPPKDGVKFLDDHLNHKPDQLATYRQFLKHFYPAQPQGVLQTFIHLAQQNPKRTDILLNHLLEVNNDRAALIEQLNALKLKDTTKAIAAYVAARCYIELDDNNNAEKALSQSLALSKDFIPATMLQIDLMITRGADKQAKQALENIDIGTAPTLKFEAARLWGRLGEVDKAITMLKELVAAYPRDIQYHITLATFHVADRAYPEAERILWKAWELDRRHEPTYEALFAIYETVLTRNRNQWRKAWEAANQFIPRARITRLKNAEVAADSNRKEQAERDYRSLLEEYPGNEMITRSMIVRLFIPANRWNDAEILLREQLDHNPDSDMFLRMYTQIAIRLDKVEQSFPVLEDFLQRKKDTPSKFAQLGELYIQWEKYAKALEAYEQVLKLDPPDRTFVHRRITGICLELKAYDKGLAYLDQAIQADPDNAPDYYYDKASLYTRLQQLDDAEKMLHAALKIDPDHPGANNDLSYHWAETNRNLDKAVTMAEKAVKADPDNSAYMDTLGWIYYKLKRYRDAVTELENATRQRGGQDAVIYDHLGDANWRLGNKTEARRHWQTALRLAESESLLDRPETTKLIKSLQAKINAVVADNDPPVAKLPDEE